MTSRRLLHLMVLAHHHPEHLDRCLLLPLGGRRLAICARCAALYPTLALGLLLQRAAHLPALGLADWLLTISGILPALLDWGLNWTGRRRGTNAMRLATGALLGLALARSIWLYLHDPRSEVFWVQGGLLVAGALAFELVRRLRL